jgi:hypothetical protein
VLINIAAVSADENCINHENQFDNLFKYSIRTSPKFEKLPPGGFCTRATKSGSGRELNTQSCVNGYLAHHSVDTKNSKHNDIMKTWSAESRL